MNSSVIIIACRLTAPKLMIIPTTTIVTTAHIGEQVLKLYWYILMGVEIRQSKINSRWVGGRIGQTNPRPSV